MKHELDTTLTMEMGRVVEEEARRRGMTPEELLSLAAELGARARFGTLQPAAPVVQLKSKGRRNGDTPKND